MQDLAYHILETHCKTVVNRTIVYWHRNRNRLAARNNLKANPCICGHFMYKKGSILNNWR